MAAEQVRIDELRLRVPGLSREEAAGLGARVGELIAAGLPDGVGAAALGALALRIELPAGTPRERLAEAIASATLERLR